MSDQPRRIIVAGAGGNSVDIVEILESLHSPSGERTYEVVGLLDDDKVKQGQLVAGKKVLGPLRSAREHPGVRFVFTVGSPENHARRDAIFEVMGIPSDRFATIVHPRAQVSRSASLGRGVVVFPMVTVGARATIGDHVLLLPHSVISHDTTVGDFSLIAGGVCLSGEAAVGKCCYLGTNCAVKGKVSVGDGTMVGMGSVVLENVGAGLVVAGNPARPLK